MLSEYNRPDQSPDVNISYGVGLASAQVLERVNTLRDLAAELPNLSMEVKQMLLDYYEYTEAYRYCALIFASMQGSNSESGF